MSETNLFEHRKEGLYFAPGDFYLDPKRAVTNAVISHGHADHAIPSNKKVWCTPATRAIMQLRYKQRLKSTFTDCVFKETFSVNGVKVSLYPAGHILGSSQVLIEYSGVRYCYTGDFKLRNDHSCEPFEVVECDVLITETTFAHPDYKHPKEEEEFEKLRHYSHTNLVIGAYNLGKAQRLTLLLKHFLPDRTVMVNHEAAIFHNLYEESGRNLGAWQPYNSTLFRRTRGNILIVPPRSLSGYYRSPDVVTTFATGWKNSPFKAHFNFHLSDHADWDEVLELIKLTRASKLITVHGDGSHLKNYLAGEHHSIKVLN